LREPVAAINSWAFSAIAESVEPRFDFAGIIVRSPPRRRDLPPRSRPARATVREFLAYHRSPSDDSPTL
jgi:hypothetical protein